MYFRDVYDHLIRIIEELDSLRDILSNVLEIYLFRTPIRKTLRERLTAQK